LFHDCIPWSGVTPRDAILNRRFSSPRPSHAWVTDFTWWPNPTGRYRDLGPEFFDNRIRPEGPKINYICQLEALGYTLTPTA
jgi:hypothetical protein